MRRYGDRKQRRRWWWLSAAERLVLVAAMGLALALAWVLVLAD